jgi:fatty-acyl-CoA synthase
LESDSPASAQSRIQTQVLEVVHQLLKELGSHRGPAGLKLEASLERDLGLGSLERVELLSRLERDLSIHLPDSLLNEAETVGDVIRRVELRLLEGETQKTQGTSAYPHFKDGTAGSFSPAVIPISDFFCGQAPPETLVKALTLYARLDPTRPHIHLFHENVQSRTITYEALLASSLSVAYGLLDRGVRRGETVALVLPTCEKFFCCFLGIQLAGGIPVPIYPPFRADRIEEYAQRQVSILQNAQVRLMITFCEAQSLARLLRPQIPSMTAVVTPDVLLSSQPGLVAESVRPETIALIQYTSGSTGNPKGVVLTHANLVANIRSVGQAVQIKPTDIGVSWLPLYHDMGLIGCWLSSLYFGIPITIMSPLDFLSRPERWLWAIHYARATLSVAPNFAYELCLSKISPGSLKGLDLSSWRAALNGAEPVSPQTLRRFSDRFRICGFREEAFIPVYGMAECAVALTFPPLDRKPKIDRVNRTSFSLQGRADPAPGSGDSVLQFVSVGRPIPGHELRVADASGDNLAERVQGHIQFRGPSMMQGYFGNPDATRDVFRNGWIDSGDLGYLAEGELYVTGRVKDIIIKAGRNLYPQEIEEVTGEISGIRRGCVAAFGVPDSRTGTERLIIVAETRMRKTEDVEQLRVEVVAHVDSCLGLPPDVVELVTPHTVPKTSSGKIRRDACKSLFLDGGLEKGRRPPWIQMLGISLASVSGSLALIFRKTLRVLYALYAWGVLGLNGIPCWFALVFWRDQAGSVRNRRILRLLCRYTLSMAGMKPELEGADYLAQATSLVSLAKPFLLVSNHSSYADALVLGAALPFDFQFVVKSEAASWPLVGRFIRQCDFPLIHREDLSQVNPDFERIVRTLQRGIAVHLFPEGTFARACGLRPFQMGAFKLAAEAGCPLFPVTLRGVREVFPEGSWLPRRHRIHVVVGAPVMPRGKDLSEQVRLRDTIREEFLRHCGEGLLDLVPAGPQKE